ncbi:MAG: carboxypeptidase-like regulatory domain-containing protein [Anaerolineae bacterium]
MWRLSYRNFGSRQTLVGNFSTDVGSDRAGVRWFELRKTGANWTLFQEGTYAPGSVSRWMGGIAMDKSGNIALGYNVGSSSTYPSLRYVGRLASDSAGTMPRGEYTIVNGSAANASNRYGDYSSMNVDPVDDCTFWFTGQWNDASQWKTRIAKMKFDSCGQVQPPPGAAKAYLPLILRWPAPPTGTVAGWVRRASNSQPISGAQVCVLSSNQCATTNAQGTYSIANVAAGNQTVRATASGYTAVQQAVTVNAGATATANFSLASSSMPHTITQSQSQAIVAENSVACVERLELPRGQRLSARVQADRLRHQRPVRGQPGAVRRGVCRSGQRRVAAGARASLSQDQSSRTVDLWQSDDPRHRQHQRPQQGSGAPHDADCWDRAGRLGAGGGGVHA